MNATRFGSSWSFGGKQATRRRESERETMATASTALIPEELNQWHGAESMPLAMSVSVWARGLKMAEELRIHNHKTHEW